MNAYGEVVEIWPVIGGTATVEGIPAGSWTLHVSDGRGQAWSATAETVAGRMAVVEVR